MNSINFRRNFYKLSISFSFVSFILISALMLTLYFNSKNSKIKDMLRNEKMLLDLKDETITYNLNNIVSDLMFLSHQNEIEEYIVDLNPNLLKEIEKEYFTFIQNNSSYTQLRFIDKNGMELIRINKNNQKLTKVDVINLQNKSDRYYFKETMKLNHDEVYISPLDLNIENDVIEHPFNPMLRFATNIENKNGKVGLVIINYFSMEILEKLKSLNLTSEGDFYFLNKNSDYIISPNVENEWNFMFDEKRNKNFKFHFAKVWEKIMQTKSGLFENTHSIFIYKTIYPFPLITNHSVKSNNSLSNNYNFKLVTKINKKEFLSKLKKNFVISYFLLVLLSAIISFLVAKILSERLRSYNSTIELARINSVVATVVTVNHEINQPLTTLEGNIEMLKMTIDENLLTEKQRRYLDRSLESCTKINNILTKFRESNDIKFTDYTDDVEMVSFEDLE